MAQGVVKKSKANAPKVGSSRRQTGSKVIKPKKASLIKSQNTAKKHTAGLMALTEKAIAGKAGHLELLGGGKRDKKAEMAAKLQKGK
ncbi:hypothetical protein B0A48_00291 [Cryoendolithus antarcticus]|uniref:Uncharacterized protein n=1 Tax=Cryoendolithus antarcticus TaxID=1507870 RepID=A0A1V8TU92_9PEZI|nr:hypothetical protein B0A48_00291 [Cryoendolithus antarcticus]OQO23032.1 hypothetical protein B0A51_08777 [Rachicladosporium sp. CCFEE 5018]